MQFKDVLMGIHHFQPMVDSWLVANAASQLCQEYTMKQIPTQDVTRLGITPTLTTGHGPVTGIYHSLCKENEIPLAVSTLEHVSMKTHRLQHMDETRN